MKKRRIFKLKKLLIFLPFILVVSQQSDAGNGPNKLSAVKDNSSYSSPIFPGYGRGLANVKSPRFATGHILVKLHPKADAQQFFQSAENQGLRKRSRVYGSNWYTVSIPPGVTQSQAMASARSIHGVLRATPDPILTINEINPNDPFYVDDEDPAVDCDPLIDPGCDVYDIVDQWGLFQVDAGSAWDVDQGSEDVVIAILDSGVDLDHDDLWDKIWTNPGETGDGTSAGVDDDNNGFVDDIHGADFCGDNAGNLGQGCMPFPDDETSQDSDPDIPRGVWYPDIWEPVFIGDPATGDFNDNNCDGYPDAGVFHGTFVAGVVGAMTNNNEGMAGACWNCKLMPVRMINAEGSAFGSDAAAAVRYAADMGADIINASWGMPINLSNPAEVNQVSILTEAIDYAVGMGVIFVASAGNSGQAGVLYPANLPNTISVGSSDWLDQRSNFSSYSKGIEDPNGIDDDNNGWIDEDIVDVVAPGELIWSTYVMSAYDAWLYYWLDPLGNWEPGSDTYASADGTSFSAPLVSGYIGLLLSQNPGLTLGQVREILRTNAEEIPPAGYDSYTGFGRVKMVVPTEPPPLVCIDNGICEEGEDCNNCPNDCISGGGSGSCGNGVCEPGEDCLSCAADCRGKQVGPAKRQYCCGDRDGTNPVTCDDIRCNSKGFLCSDSLPDPYCCGDLRCEGAEDSCNCAIDCGPPVSEICNNGIDDDCDGLKDCDDPECASKTLCECLSKGESCTSNGDCCSGRCHSKRGTCM